MTTLPPTLSKSMHRIQHERQLIGRALSCIPSALAIADVLSLANFKDPLCHQLFQLILEGVESMELDLLSITRAYGQRFDKNKTYEITQLVDNATMSSYIFNDALLLLQTDIREKFCSLLDRMEKDCAKESDFESAAIWKQCYDHMAHPGNDVFKSVDSLHSYLKNYFPDQLDEYNELKDAIPKLVDRIRKRAKTRKFLDTLTAMGGDAASHEHRMSIKILTDWLILCIGGSKLPDNFYSTINQLNSTWHV